MSIGSLPASGTYSAPDLTEPLLGFRVWELTPRGRLKSQYAQTLWPSKGDRAVRARCIQIWPADSPVTGRGPMSQHRGSQDHAPYRHCSCGLYAYYDPEILQTSAYGKNTIAGVVSSWGRIVPHPTGFRAEWMRLEAITDLTERTDARRVAARLGVPYFVHRDEMLEYALTKGKPLPHEMRPPVPPWDRHTPRRPDGRSDLQAAMAAANLIAEVRAT